MKLRFLICVLFIANGVLAQKNIIKGRAFGFPFIVSGYNLGIGYERVLSKNISIQILYNNKGGTPGLDAPTTYISGFVPETRFYFGKKESIKRKAFIGAFMEFLNLKQYPGMPDYSGDYLTETNGDFVNIGFLVGKNVSLGKNVLLDMYIGYRYKFFSGVKTYREPNGEYYNTPFNEQGSGVRIGVNLGYIF